MRRRITLLAVLALALGLIVPTAAAGAEEPAGVYISLGDSLAAGEQRSEGKVTDDSYTDVLFQKVAEDLGLATHVKLGCPGETSGTFINGGCAGEDERGAYLSGSQFGDALGAIAAAGDDLRLITINLGANDVNACIYDTQGYPSIEACLQYVALPQLAGNLTTILAVLEQAAPGVPIVGMTYYNPYVAWRLDDANAPFPGFGDASQGLTAAVNQLLAATYAGAFVPAGVPFAPVPAADMAWAFSTFDDDRNIKKVCRFTGMCQRTESGFEMTDWDPDAPGIQADIHPTDKGYRRMAREFQRTMIVEGIL